MAYVTRPQLKTYLQISDTSQDALLDLLIESVEALIESRTGRHWGDPETVTDEVYDYKPILWLRNMDITAVDAVKLGNSQTGTPTALSSGDYTWSDEGRIVLGSQYGFVPSQWNYDYVQVSYKYTAGAVPADLRLAAMQVASVFYNKSTSGGQQITREKIGNLETQYKSQDESLAQRPDILNVINGYKRFKV